MDSENFYWDLRYLFWPKANPYQHFDILIFSYSWNFPVKENLVLLSSFFATECKSTCATSLSNLTSVVFILDALFMEQVFKDKNFLTSWYCDLMTELSQVH